LSDGRQPEPGGWNRISLEVQDIAAEIERLRASGGRFRGDLIRGVGGDRVLVEDPSGNAIELFQPHPRD
jgi:predicted enzyme related to lactoylglutathione lyase